MEIKELEFSPAVFDPNKETLQAIALEVSQITADPAKMTKDDLELINSTKNKLVKARTAIQKKGKEVRAAAVKFQKDVIAYEDELIGIIEPEELRIKEIESGAKEYAMRQERLKTLPEFKEKLASIGDKLEEFLFLDQMMMNENIGSVEDYEEFLLTLDPNERDAHYNIRLGRKLEADKIAADAKRAEEDAAREAEAKKLQEEKDKIENEKKSLWEKQFNFRIQQLLEMGLKFNGEAYVKDDINVSIVEMKADSDEQFNEKVSKIKSEIVRREKVAEEQAETKRLADIKEAEERARKEAQEQTERKQKAEADRIAAEEADKKRKQEEDEAIRQKQELQRTKAEKYQKWLDDNSFNSLTDIVLFDKDQNVTRLYRGISEYSHE